MRVVSVIALLLASVVIQPAAQDNQTATARRMAFDQILDLYVRDGLVYYRALKSDRAKLDAYIAWAAETPMDSASREERLAFWLNAYDALVLKTVVDHYPIPRRSQEYPDRSIRQIPGAFERLPHRVARRMLTLDAIEQEVLSSFKDPRVYLAIGRGAMDSGRLRSEAFAPATIEAQLTQVAAECVTIRQCVEVDRANSQINISSIFSWRSQDFIAAYAGAARAPFADRSPIERAVLALVEPKLLTIEREYLAKNEFKVAFKPFDWALNDLSGRGGR
jgi:uncharacterized protein DUF547